jgi:hypothetical protein
MFAAGCVLYDDCPWAVYVIYRKPYILLPCFPSIKSPYNTTCGSHDIVAFPHGDIRYSAENPRLSISASFLISLL